MSTELWTMSQLTDRVAASLRTEQVAAPTRADAGHLNGRIREVPDARTIRWYQTTGLVDRPAAMRGRTALYGPRHLLQLLAIKRLQARGHSLADIQAELAGASDATLSRIAGSQLTGSEAAGAAEPSAGNVEGIGSSGSIGPGSPGRARFWAAGPTAPTAYPTANPIANPIAEAAAAGPPAAQLPPTTDVVGVRLADGLTVLLDQPRRPIGADAVAAIRAAAAPLVEVLGQLDLLGTEQPAPRSAPHSPSGHGDFPSEPGAAPSERGKDHP